MRLVTEPARAGDGTDHPATGSFRTVDGCFTARP
ncbi:hypothetical protein ACVWXU_002838 [Streptomyces sp. TE33382]